MDNTSTKLRPSVNYKADLQEARNKAAKPLLWIGIVSIVMLFAGLTSAYVVRADNGNWLLFDLPNEFYMSTAIILASSLSMLMAQRAVKKSNYTHLIIALGITLALGFGFCITQYQGWKVLVNQGIVFAGKYSNASGSFLYVLTGVHLAHLLGGIISLLVVFIKSLRKKYNAENRLGVELCAIYWHFLDILWVYLFLFLYFIR